MKTKTLLSLLLIAVSSLSFAQSEYNLESSKIQWKGTKITNQSHTGTLKFKEAEIKIKNNFDRITLVNFQTKERVTIDFNLKFIAENFV